MEITQVGFQRYIDELLEAPDRKYWDDYFADRLPKLIEYVKNFNGFDIADKICAVVEIWIIDKKLENAKSSYNKIVTWGY